jgi:hypothetical protein
LIQNLTDTHNETATTNTRNPLTEITFSARLPTGKRFLEWKNAALKNNAPVKVPAADSLNDVRIVNDCEKTRK